MRSAGRSAILWHSWNALSGRCIRDVAGPACPAGDARGAGRIPVPAGAGLRASLFRLVCDVDRGGAAFDEGDPNWLVGLVVGAFGISGALSRPIVGVGVDAGNRMTWLRLGAAGTAVSVRWLRVLPRSLADDCVPAPARRLDGAVHDGAAGGGCRAGLGKPPGAGHGRVPVRQRAVAVVWRATGRGAGDVGFVPVLVPGGRGIRSGDIGRRDVHAQTEVS